MCVKILLNTDILERAQKYEVFFNLKNTWKEFLQLMQVYHF